MLQLIVGDDNAVRGMLDTNGKQRFSVYDCLTILFLYNVKDGREQDQKKASSCARAFYSTLIADDSEYRDDILSHVVYLKFPGQGHGDTPTMTLAGLQKLVLGVFSILLWVDMLPESLEQPLEVVVCAGGDRPATTIIGLPNDHVIEGVHFINARLDRVRKLRHEIELHIATILILKITHRARR